MDLSVIIAYFNRAYTVGHTPASIERARGDRRAAILRNAAAPAATR